MNKPAKKEVAIIGAGLVGSLLSVFLIRRGYKVKLFEARSDMRKQVIDRGKSINLALSDRGLKALEKLGLSNEIKNIAIPMDGRKIHTAEGNETFQPYGKKGQFINSVSRGELNKLLLNVAEENGVEIFFNCKCKEIDWKNNCILFELPNKQFITTSSFDLMFGADGAYSKSRYQLQVHSDRFNYNQFFLDWGYKELKIAAKADGSPAIELNALHIWPRGDYMLIALPNPDNSFTCTLFFPFEGEISFSQLDTPEKVAAFFSKEFPDAVPVMPDLVNDFFHNPTSSLITVECFPWIRDGKFALIGDAAHAMVPFYGQGMNCGFEDCLVLDNLMDEFADDNWPEILKKYQDLRKVDADAITKLALDNFIEMRAKTADPKFLLQKKIEAKLNEQYPDKWIPTYSMVTFSPQIRYSEALIKSQKQEATMQEVMKQDFDSINWQDKDFLNAIIEKVQLINNESLSTDKNN